tara:strand:+ start:107 stop:364 length:258 start_codon:yes stop_codon:yes gene_type:complete
MSNTTNEAQAPHLAQIEISTLELELIKYADLCILRDLAILHGFDAIPYVDAIGHLTGHNSTYAYQWRNETQFDIDHLRSKFNFNV